jgi:hypothetical protein
MDLSAESVPFPRLIRRVAESRRPLWPFCRSCLIRARAAASARPRAKGLPTFAATFAATDAFARRTQLQNSHRLVELRDRTEHLANERSRRVTLCAGEVGSVGG